MYNLKDTGQPKRRNLCRLQDTPWKPGKLILLMAKLLYVTHSIYENDWPSLPHMHYFTELCYIKKGTGNYLIEDQNFPIKEDDFIIINSNTSHTERSVGEDFRWNTLSLVLKA